MGIGKAGQGGQNNKVIVYLKAIAEAFASGASNIFSSILQAVIGAIGFIPHSNLTGDFTVTPTDATKKVTISGFSGTLSALMISSATFINAAGEREAIDLTTVTVVASGSDWDVTFSDASENFSSASAVEVTIKAEPSFWDKISAAIRITNIFPVWERMGYTLLVDATNLLVGGSPYYYYIDVEGYNHLALQAILADAPTVTVEGTLQNDGTAAASITDWTDISSTLIGGSKTTSFLSTDSAGVAGGLKYIRVKIVVTAGTEDARIYYKKWFS